MDRVHIGPAAGFAGALALLAGLAATSGLGALGWLVGLLAAAVLALLLDSALVRAAVAGPGPAGWVTLVRAVLACGVAALTADALVREVPAAVPVGLAAVALTLDAVDGWLARRTGTETALGARFDMEVDAFLIAVLSVLVAPAVGAWVLAIGAMRYAYVVAGWLLPWLRRPTPPRYAAKVVAAVQGVVLAVVASGLLPAWAAVLALAAALALLVDSFGRDVWWQWRHRRDPEPVPARGAWRPAVPGGVLTGAALVGVWVALVLPDVVGGVAVGDLLRIPLEGLVLVAVALVLPPLARRVLAAGFGVVLAALVLLRALDLGFGAVLDRSFDPLADWRYLGPGVGVLGDSIGDPAARLVAVGVAVLAVALLVLLPVAAARVVRVAADHRRRSARTLVALGTAWAVCAAVGLQAAPVARVASVSAADLAVDTVGRVRDDVRDRGEFADLVEADAFAGTPPDRLLTGLRGKDVLLVFIESYGRVAVHGSSFAPGIEEVLRDGGRRLAAAGYGVRSAYLTSPTFGAASWLAHATAQSGLWVDSEQRYGQLLESDRLTLTSAFRQAGWRTVFDVPANTEDWPEGADFYGFDHLYDSRNVGYQGPEFGYASMPDQYTLEHFRREELAPRDRRPVMAEIDLISSHHPWTPLPQPVPWDRVGDGSVFDGMPEQGLDADEAFEDPDQVRRLYGESIEYTLETLVSFLETYPDRDLVLVVLGDHQPHSYVSGDDAGHDVPVSVIAQDRAVLRRIRDWRWEPGLRPGPDAPVWPMDDLRDRLLTAYGPR